MEPSNSIAPNRNRLTAETRTALAIALGCFLCSAGINLQFYFATRHLAPGHEIRPMLEVSALGLLGIVSILGGGGVALYAAFLSLRRKQWLQFAYALLALGATWIPIFAGFAAFNHLVAIRKLVLER